tara:strand:- start:225 stop:656 length:432 start_codon:yes stop_codon:yes gene_type:complete
MTTTKNSKNTSAENNLFAIAETSGRQFLLQVNKYYDLDRIDAKEKEKIILNNILLIKDNKNTSIGKPYIKNAKVELEVMSHLRDKKIIVYKMRPKKKTRRKMGHRQELTRVMVKSITIDKAESKNTTKSESSKKSTSIKKEKS